MSIECEDQSQEWLEQLRDLRISYLPVFSMFLPQEERRTPAVIEDALARADAWARRFSPQGSIVAARLDPAHWLCFGLGERLPVLVSGRTARCW